MPGDTPLTVMIPLGGIGSRFQKEGYTNPKPFVSALGKPMILWVIDSLLLKPCDELVIVFNPDFLPRKWWQVVRAKYPRLRLVELPGPTRGAAETVLIGLQGLPRDVRGRPVMLVDGDTFYGEDIVSKYREASPTANGVFYFVDTQPKPIYSYITFEPSSRRITQVKEKVKISDNANSGCYCFMNGLELEAQCQSLLDAGSTQTGELSTHTVGEYYTSGVIAQMIEEGHPFRAIQIQASRYHVLGTPSQLQAFCRSWPQQPALRVCFDLDNTLVTAPKARPLSIPACPPRRSARPRASAPRSAGGRRLHHVRADPRERRKVPRAARAGAHHHHRHQPAQLRRRGRRHWRGAQGAADPVRRAGLRQARRAVLRWRPHGVCVRRPPQGARRVPRVAEVLRLGASAGRRSDARAERRQLHDEA